MELNITSREMTGTANAIKKPKRLLPSVSYDKKTQADERDKQLSYRFAESYKGLEIKEGMMIKRFLIAILALQMISSFALAMEVGNVHLPDSLRTGENSLILNGAGFRKKLFIKVYAAGLYLLEKQSDPEVIIGADKPMAIRMHFVYHKVSSKKLIKGWNEGFEKATEGNVASLKHEIQTFNSFFKTNARKNDIYDLIYIPEHGVDVYIKGYLVGTVQGLDFKKALFAIWLGDKPADSGLKKNMLGK